MSALAPNLLTPQKISRHPPPDHPRRAAGRGDHNASADRQPNPLNNLPLLSVGYARRVEPIGKLIAGPCRVMPDEGGCEVLGNPCALTLGDEPFAGRVEHGAAELWVEAAQVAIPLHHFIDSEIREQPTSPRQSSIQQLLKDTM